MLSTGPAGRLGKALEAVGYSTVGLSERFGVPASAVDRLNNAVVRSLLVSAEDPVADLLRMFLLGETVDAEGVGLALAPVSIEELIDAGVLQWAQADAKTVTSLVHLTPVEGLLLASDPNGTEDRDYVAGVGPASLTLAYLTVREQGQESMLDLGTGCGVQTLLAARHCRGCLAVDVNDRAIALAEFNAALNGADNVATRQGSWLEPVGEQRFDLIASNPPYVLSPTLAYVFRDSPLPGDGVCEQLVRAIPERMRAGGYATVLCNWAFTPGEDWSAPVQAWLTDRGCDALLLGYAFDTPQQYAARWNEHLQMTYPERFLPKVREWLDYYEGLGIEAIASGAVVLRRRTSQSSGAWVRAIEAPAAPEGPAGDQLLRMFAAQDLLARGSSEQELLKLSFTPVEDLRLEQAVGFRAGAFAAEPATARLAGGLGVAAPIPPTLLQVVMSCDGTRTLGELLEEACGAQEPQRAELTQAAVASMARLLELGLVTACGELASDTAR